MSVLRIALWLSLCLLWGACENSEEDLESVRVKGEVGYAQAKGVELLYSDSAIVRIRIRAPRMLTNKDLTKPVREFPEGVNVDFFDENKQVSSRLFAKYGKHLQAERKVVLRDSVVVFNNRGERLETEELFWEEANDSLYSNKFVKIITPTKIIYGHGMRSNLDFSVWEIDSVRGVVMQQGLQD